MDKKLTLPEIAIKARSKKEVYYVLSAEGGIYLPPIMDANSSYLKDIVRGKKKFLYNKDVKVTKVPQIKELYIADLLNWGKDNSNIDSYLPEYKYAKHPNRDWLWNILNSIAHDKFQKFVKIACKNREQVLVLNMGLQLAATPEIAKIFSESQNVSYEKGRTHFLLRDIKRKRRWYEMEDDMKVDDKSDDKVKELKSKIKSLEDQIENFSLTQDELLKDKEKLVVLYQKGIIDSDGEAIEQ